MLKSKMIELKNLKLLAQGGQAEIYEFEQEKVIRVLRNKEDEEYLKVEMYIMKSLKERNKPVPKVYDFLKIEDRPSVIMEKLEGDTMLTDIRKNPLKLLKNAEKLAKLHIEVTDSSEGLQILSVNDRAKHLISKAEKLDDNLKEFIFNILSELPRVNHICHGDFHPGNIIIAEGNHYIIDWFGATSGDKLSDIAHTYLILRNTPKIPGVNSFQNFIIGISGNVISQRYIKTCEKLCSFDWNKFSKWMVVRAAERVFYGMPTEKEVLIKFIKKCKEAKESGVKSSDWWKLI